MLYSSNFIRFSFGITPNQTITNSYDYLNDRISAVTHNGFSYNFGYDALGNNDRVDVGTQNLITNTYKARTSNLLQSTYGNGQIVSSGYDNLDRVISRLYNGSARNNYTYDASGNIGFHEDVINGTNHRYIYDTANRLVKVQDNKGSVLSYGFDLNNNTSNISDKINNNYYTMAYGYDKDNKPITTTYNRATTNTITQSYDILGRATGKTLNTGVASYNTTFGYLPGASGATTSKVGTITYDSIGNPLTYNGNTYTWEEGRQLATLSGNGNTISYKYNDAGIRTQKIVNGVTTNYHLVGDKVTYEDNGTDKIYYTYDASSKLVSMSLNGVEYYYIRNAQGDIIGLFDKTGAQVVTYTYDTWGKLISTTGTLASTVGVKNPYRYRGYRYDTETGLYYLQSRYYSSEWGRFINADAIIGQPGDLLGVNVFAYCQNNCVNAYDPNGFQMLAEDGGGGGNGTYGASNSGVVKKSILVAIGDAAINMLKDVPESFHYFPNRSAIRAADSIIIPVAGGKFLSTIGKIGTAGKIGIIGGSLEGISIWDNFARYKHPYMRTLTEFAGIGIGIVAVAIFAGIATAVALPAIAVGGLVVAVGAGFAATAVEDKWYGQRR